MVGKLDLSIGFSGFVVNIQDTTQRPIRTWWFSTIIPILFTTLVLTEISSLIYSTIATGRNSFGELKYDFRVDACALRLPDLIRCIAF
jgi:hypothetical protein